jgi:hypothetical protein
MANRVPLIVDVTTEQVKELPVGDNLDLSNSSISAVQNITSTGSITANTITVAGNLEVSGVITNNGVPVADSIGSSGHQFLMTIIFGR